MPNEMQIKMRMIVIAIRSLVRHYRSVGFDEQGTHNMRYGLWALLGAALLVFTTGAVHAQSAATIRITDVSNRIVEVAQPIRRMILGEGRQIYLLAALDREEPFGRVVGWRDDFEKADYDGYQAYKEKYPFITDLPKFGGTKEGTFDVEQAVALRPDVIVMNLEAKAATEEAGLLQKLAKVGIPVVFIDFRERPFENSEASIRVMGQLLDRTDRAEDLIAFRKKHVEVVQQRLATYVGKRPTVMIERAAGYSEECCMSFGDENFGRMVKLAGGDNIAARLIPGTFGTINPEQIVASNPEVVIVTGSNWKLYVPNGQWVGVGSGADAVTARERLVGLMQRPPYRNVQAVATGRVHAIWHQFYDSPYQFVAIQALAKWLHPELFTDLDPDATFQELHDRFLPVAYKPGYWVSMQPGR
jgi:iron complex transport system substrate-binding protein